MKKKVPSPAQLCAARIFPVDLKGRGGARQEGFQRRSRGGRPLSHRAIEPKQSVWGEGKNKGFLWISSEGHKKTNEI